MVPPKTNFFFFLFSNLGLIIAHKPVFISIVLWPGMTHLMPSYRKKCALWERGLVKLVSLEGVSLI